MILIWAPARKRKAIVDLSVPAEENSLEEEEEDQVERARSKRKPLEDMF